MFTALIFILVLGLLVLVHELGHFIAAKKSGCYVEEFAIGFPPRLLKYKKGETLYTLNLLPVGGYVKIRGENGGNAKDPRDFTAKSFGWKFLIVSAGVLMNILLGYVLITTSLIIGIPTDFHNLPDDVNIKSKELVVIEVLPNSPATEAGILPGDYIKSVDQQPINGIEGLQNSFNDDLDKISYSVEIQREGQVISKQVKPVYIEEANKYGIGVGLIESGVVSYPWYSAPWEGVKKTVSMLWAIVNGFATLLMRLFTGSKVSEDIAGPIGIAVITGEVARLGAAYLINFMAILSLNLAIINIMPFPALDGGRLLFIVIEKLRRKSLKMKTEYLVNLIGFACLMGLMLLVTVSDVLKHSSEIGHFFSNLF